MLAQMSEEARAAYDAKAQRKREGWQRWLDAYKTQDKKPRKKEELLRKKAFKIEEDFEYRKTTERNEEGTNQCK